MGLVTVTALSSSTALGNHLDEHTVLGIHKHDEGAWYSQDPTLQKFLAPAQPLHPQPQTAKTPEPSSEPTRFVSPPQPKQPAVVADQRPVAPPMERGWKFLLNGQPNAAMAAYRQEIGQHPNSASALLGMGMTLKSLGKMDEAKTAITQALELNPQLASALVHLGYLYADGPSGIADPETARRLFQQARHLGDPFARIALLDLQARTAL
jgi:tetratricopeptide (TPR) repeat protein